MLLRLVFNSKLTREPSRILVIGLWWLSPMIKVLCNLLIFRSLVATYGVILEQNPSGILISKPIGPGKWVVENFDSISPGLLGSLCADLLNLFLAWNIFSLSICSGCQVLSITLFTLFKFCFFSAVPPLLTTHHCSSFLCWSPNHSMASPRCQQTKTNKHIGPLLLCRPFCLVLFFCDLVQAFSR